MKSAFSDLVDVEKLRTLLDGVTAAMGVATAIVDVDGKVITAAGWQEICTLFHRVHPDACERCTESDTALARQVKNGDKYSIYQCRNGLVDAAAPIVIEGVHVGNVFTGQFLLQRPDVAFFRAQAAKFGFDETAYIEALSKVPIVTRDQITGAMDFLASLAEIIGTAGLAKKRLLLANAELREREALLDATFNATQDGILVVDTEGKIAQTNRQFAEMWQVPQELLDKECDDALIDHVLDQLADPDAFQSKIKELYHTSRESLDEIGFKDGRVFERFSCPLIIDEKEGGRVWNFTDITDRRRAEQTLQASERNYREIFEGTNDAIFVHELSTGSIVGANRKASELMGYSIEELCRFTVGELSAGESPYSQTEAAQRIKKAIEEGPQVFEWLSKRKNGELFWVEVSLKLAVIGGQDRVLAIARDITQRKQAEQEHLAHVRFLESLEQIDRVICRTDDLEAMMGDVLEATRVILDCDRAFLIYPCDPDAPTFRVPMECVRPGYPGALAMNVEVPITPDAAELLREELATDGPVSRVFQPGGLQWDPDDEFGVRSMLVMAVYPKSGKPWSFGLHQCSHARLWTDQEQRLFKEIGRRIADALSSTLLLRDLRESEERYRVLFENAGVMISVYDRHGICLMMNNEVAKRFSAAPGELVGKSFHELHPEDAADYLARIREIFDSGRSVNYEDVVTFLEGDRWLLSNVQPIRDANGDVFAAQIISQDITERKQAEQEREKLIERLEAQNAELERFAYTVSHDLKTPLITMKGFMGALREDLAREDTKNVRDDLLRMENAAEVMARLLSDLLELSRIGRLVNPPQEISLAKLAREAVEMAAGPIAARGVRVEISPDLPVVVGDRPRLLEVVQNLIDNAVKYMGDQPQPCIEVGAQRRDDEWVFHVRDNGMGIEPEYQDKVFGLFEQLNPKIEGSGVGLALVKRIVEVHGGRIWVESNRPSRGSTFYFTLPSRTQHSPAEVVVNGAELASAQGASRER